MQDNKTAFALRMLKVSGQDARAFLQSQLSSDVESADDTFRATAWCNPKGRVEGVLLINSRDEIFHLVLPAPIADAVEKRLDLFRIGRRVEIESAGAAQPAAPSNPAAIPLALDRSRALLASADDLSPLPSSWLRKDIDRCFPWVLPPTQARFLPQMLGLEALQGLSYRKGCFPGQEVIARVHYRGRVTQRTARLTFSGAAPRPGAEIHLASGTGTILYAVAEREHGDGRDADEVHRYQALAVVPADAAAGEQITDAECTGVLVN